MLDTALPAPAPALGDRLEFETLIADVSARLLSASPDTVDAAVTAALDDVRTFFEADRCALIALNPERGAVLVSQVSHADENHPLPAASSAQSFPWSHQKLVVERVSVLVSRLADLPREAARDRATFEALGVRSNLTIPIVMGSTVTHLVVVQTVRAEREWPDVFVRRLRLLGEMLVNKLENKRAYMDLRASEAHLDLAAAAAGTGLFEMDLAGDRLAWATSQTRSLYGCPKGETLTRERALAAVHPDDRQVIARALQRAITERCEYAAEYRVVWPDGSVHWLAVRGRINFDAKAQPTRALGAAVDITVRKRAEAALTESEARFRQVAENAGEFIWEFDANGLYTYASPSVEAMLGYRPDELVGRMHFYDLFEPSAREAMKAAVFRDIAARTSCRRAPNANVSKSGTIVHLETSAVPVLDAAGHLVGYRGADTDVTERKRLEAEARQQLEEIRRLRDRLHQENVYLRHEVKQHHGRELVVGRSPAIRRAIALAQQVAVTSSSVLLLGETGTGKERFASLIHDASPRRERAMIRVNCSAIPAALIESELFGREKGAYTGALSKQIGRFELAHGSTLFLDEVGDLPAEVQVKLLRALEEHTIERLGNPRPVTVDVRIVAATHRDLERAVREGTFRKDLYYRLNVFPITVPPLRERRDDIPLLVDTFVDECAAAMGKRVDAVAAASMAALVAHPWHGNVRELRNVVERAMILATGPILTVDLPPPSAAPPGTDLHDVERAHILQVLTDCAWRVRGPRGAAERLGLRPTTLEARMKKLGLQRPGSTSRS